MFLDLCLPTFLYFLALVSNVSPRFLIDCCLRYFLLIRFASTFLYSLFTSYDVSGLLYTCILRHLISMTAWGNSLLPGCGISPRFIRVLPSCRVVNYSEFQFDYHLQLSPHLSPYGKDSFLGSCTWLPVFRHLNWISGEPQIASMIL